MAEDFQKAEGSKTEQYKYVLSLIEGLISAERDATANMANISAVLKEQFGWLWTGFYLVKENELVLGPFQGPLACTRIAKGKGVCGKAWGEGKSLVVEDVEKFPGHIACSSRSRSEIVVPLIKNGLCIGVIDADSEELNAFDGTDKLHLETLADMVCRFL